MKPRWRVATASWSSGGIGRVAFYARRLPGALALLLLLGVLTTVRADPVLPGYILDPKTPAEAWNVIRLATKNVDLLLEETRLTEIPLQISYCSPALRALPGMAASPGVLDAVRAQVARAFTSVNAIPDAAKQNNGVGVASALASLRGVLGNMARHFDPQATAGDLYSCPMDFITDNVKTPCAKCGMGVIIRRIPYSFLYTKPGEPSVRMTVRASGPAAAGKMIEVKLHMEKLDGSPVLLSELMEMHTQRIHLLIEEPGLGDYHHEHPAAAETPGDYTFSFTPVKTAPYRIWADIVPAATGVQELPFVDLPSAGGSGPIENTANRFTSVVGEYHFALSFTSGNSLPTWAGQARQMEIAVTDSKGKPVKNLEPVMNAFAHLVGFYDDYRTVVHLHPSGGDVVDPSARGGPTLGFVLFAPKPGFIRLYCQVSLAGQMLFAPFNLNVEP